METTIIEPLKLRCHKKEQVKNIALKCADADIVINNAGVAEYPTSFTDADTLEAAELEMKVNYHGTHYVS